MPDLTMPRLSDAMQEGTIVQWLKQPGDAVRQGEPLAEITDGATTETYAAEADGVLEAVLVEAGATAPVGAPIARVAARERALASPMARRLAREEGVDLHAVSGSGPGGRIVAADVTAEGAAPAPAPDPAPAHTGTAKGDVTVVEPTRAQQTLARRIAEAKATVPDFTLGTEVDMEHCVALRAQLATRDLEAVPTIGDLIVKACGLALREFPRANAAYRDGRFELYSRVNVGLSVATEEGLVAPTIFDADVKPLQQIAIDARELLAKVEAGTLAAPELSGATFTVSNLGAYGVTEPSAIITTPQAAALAVGAVTPRAVVREGAVVVRHTMQATLTCDHRILYGADAAAFLQRIRALLEQPAAMLV